MKKLLLTSIISAVASICFAQPARVQIINNSPDSALAMLDVYFNGSLEANDLMYKGATAMKPIPQTGMPVRISFAPHSGMYPTDTFYSIVTTFNQASTYVLVINGTKDQARYSPARPFRVDIYNGAKETSSNPQETDILFAHGSTDLGTVDLRIGLSLMEDNINFGNFGTGYKTFQTNLPPPAQRVLRVTNTNGNKTISAHMLDLMPFMGQAIVVLPSGFLNPGVNRNGPQLTFIAVAPNGQVMDLPATASDIARIQLIHNSADSRTSTVDVYLNDSLAFNNVSFRTATSFLDIFATTNLTIGVAPSNSTKVADTFFSTDIYLDPDTSYIGILSGIESTTGYSPSRPLSLSLYDKGREEGTNSSMVDVLVFNGSTDAPDIDIQNGSNTVLINDLGYGKFSNYISLATAPTIINVTDGTGKFLRRYNAQLTGFGGQAGTVLASGFLDTAANSNGPRFGLYIVPPTGGALMALQEVFVSVNDVNNANSRVKLFPNPAADRLYITGQLSANASAMICDMTGKEVIHVNDIFNGINVDGLATGLYMLKVQDGEHMYHQKFSKQ